MLTPTTMTVLFAAPLAAVLTPSLIARAMDDPTVFGPFFDAPSWTFWKVIIRALFNLPMTPEQLALALHHSGRKKLPAKLVRTLFLMIGRRGGKSRICALIAVALAVFADYTSVLVPGETGVVLLVAPTVRQGRILLGYVMGFLNSVGFLRNMIVRETEFAVELNNNIIIEVRAGDFKTVRGFTLVAGIVDELSFFGTDGDSAISDTELLNAIRPAMASVPGSLLICSSTPYAAKGELHRAYGKYFGDDGADDTLFFCASSLAANPSLNPQVVEQAFADDSAVASAEFGQDDFVSFRTDVSALFAPDVIQAAVLSGQYEIAPQPGMRAVAFVDAAGGSGSDSMTMAIATGGADGGALLAVREAKPPFNPDQIVKEFADLLRAYGVRKVTGDRYAGDWPASSFKAHGVQYEPSELTKSEIYLEVLPLFNSRRIMLLDNDRLIRQFSGLERRTSRGGRDSVDHAPGGHDDLCNASAGALLLAAGKRSALTQDELFERIRPRVYVFP